MSDVYEQSLEFHKKHGGKIEVRSKVALKDRETLSLAYTPGVAEISRKISEDKKLAYEYTLKKNTVAIVSDGSAILGLGNLGASAAIPVMEGKAAIFKEFAGVDAFPICVETQDTEEIISLVKNIAPVFGAVNLEDISAPRCFEIEKRLKEELDIFVMHDDQHGTACVVLAGLINSLKLAGKKKEDANILVNGAGAAGIAIVNLLLEYGFENIILADTKGLVYEGREDLDGVKKDYANRTNRELKKGDLSDGMKGLDVFIGVSKGNLLNEEMIRKMNAKPIIFAMANPTPEIMPDVATSAGAFIVATGRSDFPNQVNNALAYPAIFRAALDLRITKYDSSLFITAAEALASVVATPTPQTILPGIFDPNIVPTIVAKIKEKFGK
jgi:malate dehydrogenase (oxaloacetate-decarboxylating)